VTENATEAVRLLVVSREASVLRPLWSIGESNAWHLETAGSGWEALERIQSGVAPHLLLLDLPRGEADSLHILRWLRRLRPELPIILLSYSADSAQEKEAVRLGAKDFLVQPFKEEQLESAIRRHLTLSNDRTPATVASEDIEQLSNGTLFVGASPVMQALRAQAELLAQANVPVLIVGEAGSGRETTARLIHKLSVRSEFRFLKVSCAALPGELLENELFGRGGSDDERSSPGKLELCDSGTIFLDEIVHMPISLQEKLLHVIQTKQLAKPGTGIPHDVDVRVLAATDVNIEKALSEKALREDLYYRLSAFTVHVPPLRQRKDEIPFLLQHFMHKLASHYGLPPRDLSPAVLEASQRYSWPGNVRELENFVKRYLMIGDGDLTMGWSDAEDASGTQSSRTRSIALCKGSSDDSHGSASSSKSLKSLIENVKCEAERNAIAAALERTGWNRKAAARLLKVSYRTMFYKIDQYQLRPSAAPQFPEVQILPGNGNRLKGNGTVG
jgi:two-component system response regulator AtoC